MIEHISKCTGQQVFALYYRIAISMPETESREKRLSTHDKAPFLPPVLDPRARPQKVRKTRQREKLFALFNRSFSPTVCLMSAKKEKARWIDLEKVPLLSSLLLQLLGGGGEHIVGGRRGRNFTPDKER